MTEPVKILVIDDSEDDRLLYRRSLKNGGGPEFTVVEAADGEEGLRHIGKELPDCILLDYSLPGHNGVEVLKRIRALHSFAAVVMLTGQGNEAVAVTAMQEGAQNYISKANITYETLQHSIHTAIERCALQKRIDEQRASLEIFTRALAHDLKEPVRTISSFLGLLAEEQDLGQKGKEYLAYIRSAAGRMGALIDAVYFYLRLDGTESGIQKESCDLAQIIEEAKQNIGELIRERSATIHTGDLPRDIYANRTQLLQMIQNLLCNAIHHCEKAPVIRIDASAAPDHWRLSVSDNGPGVELSEREVIFEPFKRMVRHEKPGLGLGLAICRKIAETHGGKIWCEAAKDGGAMFVFTLQRQEALKEAVKPAAAATEPEKLQPQVRAHEETLAHVLLVEDNEADIALTRIILLKQSKLKCTMSVARSGREALAMLQEAAGRQAPFDLLLLDINMPEMNGFELLDQMKKEEKLRSIPVIMCTTSTYDKDMEKAKALGAAGYMNKPPELERLRPIVEKLSGMRLAAENGGYSLLRAAE